MAVFVVGISLPLDAQEVCDLILGQSLGLPGVLNELPGRVTTLFSFAFLFPHPAKVGKDYLRVTARVICKAKNICVV